MKAKREQGEKLSQTIK